MGEHKGSRILLVEDEALLALAEAQMLRENGYDVALASSGEKAIAAVESDARISMILMDIDLGRGLSGPQAAERILAIRSIPILFLSSHIEREIVEKVKGIARFGYVIKDSCDFVLLSSIEMAYELHDAHEKTRDGEEWLSTTLHSIGDAVIATDLEGRVSRINKVAERLTGWCRAEALGRPLQEIFRIINAHSRLPVENPVELVLARGQIIGLANHTILVARDGSEYQIADSAAPIRNKDGTVGGVILTFSDVSAEYAAQEALSESRERFRLLFQNMTSGFALHRILLDGTGRPRDYRFLEVNPAFERLTGLEARSLIGKTVLEALPGTEAYWIERYGRVALGGEPERFENYSRELDRTFEVAAYSPEPGTFAVIVQDITERKRTEAALAASEERNRTILEHIGEGICLVDTEERFTYANPAAEAMFSVAAGTLEGKSVADFTSSEEYLFLLSRTAERARGESGEYELEIRRPAGDARTLHVTAVPQLDSKGNFTGTFAAFRDVTERKREREKTVGLLAEKELLLREVHHRIKNNMNGIGGLLSLQADSSKDGSVAAALRDAFGRVQSMQILYDKLYRSSNFRQLSSKDYFESLVTGIKEALSPPGRIALSTRCDEVPLDARGLFALGIILNELVTNALKHAFPGERAGTIRIEFDSAPNDMHVLKVRDDGRGMPEEIEDGAGFGLVLVKALVGQLEGTMGISRGEGTEIRMDFPRLKAR